MLSMLAVHTECGQRSKSTCAVDCGREMVLGTIRRPQGTAHVGPYEPRDASDLPEGAAQSVPHACSRARGCSGKVRGRRAP